MKTRLSEWVACLFVSAALGCQGESSPTGMQRTQPDANLTGAAGAAPAEHEAEKEPDQGGEAKGGPYCIISADCATGMFCDLGECVTECTSDLECAGNQQCSRRGRCLAPGEDRHDPPPVAEKIGTMTVRPTSFLLTDKDTSFEIRLETAAVDPVDYRVELSGPHLSLAKPRGQIEGDEILRIDVDPNQVKGFGAFGSLHIYTDLGNLVVDAPIRVGITDSYAGVLRYTAGGMLFGQASLGLELQEQNGDVEVRVDPERSLLFPESLGTAGGRGIFTVSEGLQFTIAQRIEHDAGGDRNHLERPIGRTLSFDLGRTEQGNWEGTFEERTYGLFAQPVTLHGTAFFSRGHVEPEETFDLGEIPAMPDQALDSLPDPSSSFSWPWDTCEASARQAAGCSQTNSQDCLETALERAYYEPLFDALTANLQSPSPLSDLRSDCESELFATDMLQQERSCAVIPPLACGLRSLVSSANVAEEWVAETFSRLYARTLAPALFVAQDHVVEGLRRSLIEGSSAPAGHYDKARAALNRPLEWLLHPAILEFLRRVPVASASGDPNAEDPTARNFPAVRTLSRALYVLSLLDAEQAQLAKSDMAPDLDSQRDAAQTSALFAFLEATALSAVLESWGSPPQIGVELAGFLSELDRSFAALSQGPLSFGVPRGEISFVYDPARSQPTNFEQLLLLDAAPALSQFAADERAFLQAEHEYEQNQAELDQELERLRNSHDETLRSICGSEFDPDSVALDVDWASCGASGTGQIGELSLQIEEAHLRMQASEARVLAAHRKVEIDRQRLADTQNVHQETLRFIDRSGDQLEDLITQETILNAVQSAMSVAANSSVFNGGAPIAMAAGVALLEGMRGQIEKTRQRLQTAKEMRFEAAGAEIELINGMAEIQRQLVDLTQLELEVVQEGLAIAQANLRRTNALDTAKRIHFERERILRRILDSSATDPTHRVLQDRLALQALASRATAQRWLYRAGRALEYEINTPLGDTLNRAVLGAFNSHEIERLSNCYQTILSEDRTSYGVPQDFSTTLSVRRMLGVTGPRTDEVTGKMLSAGELFRRILLTNQTLDTDGNVRIQFSTNLMPGNDLWSTNVCNDKITSVKAQLVGDFQGDDEAEIGLLVEGGAVMRRCDSEELIHWHLDSQAIAIVQAGTNTLGPTANTSLFGQSVARPSWTLVIPSGVNAPANKDLNLEQLEDIVLEITHRALPRREGRSRADIACLGSVGAGL